MAVFGPLLPEQYPFTEMFFLDDALRVRDAVQMPLVLLGGVVSRDNLDLAMTRGFELVAIGRALIADPDLVLRMELDPKAKSRCNHCNLCMVEMDRDGVRCVLDDL